MGWVIGVIIGLTIGAIFSYAFVQTKHNRSLDREKKIKARENQLRDAVSALERKEQDLKRELAAVLAKRQESLATREKQLDAMHTEREKALTAQHREMMQRFERFQSERRAAIQAREEELAQRASELDSKLNALEQRIISYDELARENSILKQDLQNLDVDLHKLRLNFESVDEKQRSLDERSNQLCRRYLKETVKLVGDSLTPNNFALNKNRLTDVIARCREVGFNIPPEEEAGYLADLRSKYELVVKAAFEREEQARIKAQIREEEKLRREIEREKDQLERERLAIQAALDQALAEAHDRHSEEVERLTARLAEAESKQRAISMAEQTRAGNVYVLSNIGSFGKGVFKVGMTRRLEPMDRVRELGDASVPFPFDVHMVISCTDAPALEYAIHHALRKERINRVNPRKEYFRTDIETIVQVVREHRGCDVSYVADSEALEYNQSLALSEEDAEYIESVYEEVEDERDAVVED